MFCLVFCHLLRLLKISIRLTIKLVSTLYQYTFTWLGSCILLNISIGIVLQSHKWSFTIEMFIKIPATIVSQWCLCGTSPLVSLGWQSCNFTVLGSNLQVSVKFICKMYVHYNWTFINIWFYKEKCTKQCILKIFRLLKCQLQHV